MVAKTLTGTINVKYVDSDGSGELSPLTSKNLLKDVATAFSVHLLAPKGTTAGTYTSYSGSCCSDGSNSGPSNEKGKPFSNANGCRNGCTADANCLAYQFNSPPQHPTAYCAFIYISVDSPSLGGGVTCTGENPGVTCNVKDSTTMVRSASVGVTTLLISPKTQGGGCKIQKAPGGGFHNSAEVMIANGEPDVNFEMKCTNTTATGVVIKATVSTAINGYVYTRH
jgi:hypothetical protein